MIENDEISVQNHKDCLCDLGYNTDFSRTWFCKWMAYAFE